MAIPRLLIAACFAGAFAALAVSGDALAELKPQPKTQSASQDAARGAAQAARAAAETADAAADTDIYVDLDEGAKSPLDRSRQGVVLLERQGKPIAVGTVLKGDGRILTALSSLGHGNGVDARFADGSVSQVRVGHVDRAWDLALLVPQNGRWRTGLRASRRPLPDAEASLHAFTLVANKQLMRSRALVTGTRTLLGGDSELLRDALELTSQFKPSDVGSPIVDSNGDVMAVVARACAPAKQDTCTPVPYGVPVSAVKAFLRGVPRSAVPPAPWLGIRGAAGDTGTVRGVRVLEVNPGSPAAASGIRRMADSDIGDLVVAVDGFPVTTPEQLVSRIGSRAVGDSVDLLLFGGTKFRHVSVTLRAAPNDKRSQWGQP
jgi:serine protease Do